MSESLFTVHFSSSVEHCKTAHRDALPLSHKFRPLRVNEKEIHFGKEEEEKNENSMVQVKAIQIYSVIHTVVVRPPTFYICFFIPRLFFFINNTF